ncbi:MAG: hypothetical protein EA414_07945 [Arthrospira sp. PLM2.Bin9]|nr:hypothetical protein [Arthrospira sp. PLM2.Bin9]TVU54229.1 MAG: hypothetical protein EA414_07945 [Arthrospira sp. PLM2.Bin9]
MIDRKPKQNRWLELRSPKVATPPPAISNRVGSPPKLVRGSAESIQPERKSRKERLKELRMLLESETIKRQPSPPPEPEVKPEPTVSSALVTVVPPTVEPSPPSPRRNNPLKASLPVLGLLLVLATPPGVAYVASSLLLRSPSLPNCPKIFWPLASASLRLYCAEMAASKKTLDDFLLAFELVSVLSEDHPLRPEINRHIDQWSMGILNLAESKFQAGELSEAIRIAKKTPPQTSASATVEQQIKQWQEIWKRAEGIYRKVEDLMRREELNLAFREATQLLNVGNNYWETVRYQKLTDLLHIAREDSQKLAEARSLANQGGVNNLLLAIKKLEEISDDSYLQDQAKKEVSALSKSMMTIAEDILNQGQWQEAIATVNKIPSSANLTEEVKDFIVLARAHVPALLDTPEGLTDAIAQAGTIERNRPLYWKAQQYIRGWQQEIADLTIMNEASRLARSQTIPDLRAAIAKLQLIPVSHSRGSEARKNISQWNQKIEEIEDRPNLDMAEKLASFGDVDSLKAAVERASQIGRGRALYDEAQERINEWRARSERLEFQPVLDRAQELAAQGDFANAIAVAEQIRPGLLMYEQARADINQWRSQLQDIQNLQNAETSAIPGTIDGLIRGIQLADRVSRSSSWRWRADQLINDWSQTLFTRGLDQAIYDISGAIETLKTIPPGTTVYNSAQAQISDWQSWLNPATPVPYEQPTVPRSVSPTIEFDQPPDLNKPIRSDN